MADRLRIVTLRWPKPPAVIADLSNIGTSRDSFGIKVGDATPSMSAATNRWGGERTVAERRSNAALTCTLLVRGATPNAALVTVQNTLESAVPANAPDLAIEWRPDGGTYSEYWRVRGPAVYAIDYSWKEFASANLFKIDITFPVAPTASGAPYDIIDDFSIDTIGSGDWIKDAGTNNLLVSGGNLLVSATGGAVAARYRHARGYPYGDVEVALTIRSSVSTGTYRICLGMDTSGGETYLALDLTSTSSRLIKVVAGAVTQLSAAGSVPLVVGAQVLYYMLLRREGNVLYWRVSRTLNWTEWTVEPNTYQLTGADLRFAAPGHVGVAIIGDTTDFYDDFSAKPFVYRGIQSPEQVQLIGTIVGEAPAEADIEVTQTSVSNTLGPIFGLVGWSERPQVPNLCTGGNLTQIKTGSATYGWAVGAVSGVIGAASSFSRAAPSAQKYGASILQISTPATTDTGANFLVTRRFKRGRVYGLLAWVGATSGTVSMRVKLGISGDLSTGAAKTALLGPSQVYSTVWQPTADRDSAYIAIGTNAATATSIEADGIVLVESPTVTLSAAIASTSATTCSPYYTPTDIPYLNPDGSLSQPFLAFIDQEIIRVNAISNSTWTIDRAQEGSLAATHAADSFVVILPPARPQLEGKGAQPVFGVLEGEYYALDREVLTVTAGAQVTDYRGGSYAVIPTGGVADYYVDPSSVLPDDFAQGDVLVEVWGRFGIKNTGTGMVVVCSATSSEQYDPTNAASSVAGFTRYTLEYGSAGMPIAAPTPALNATEMLKLGTLPMVADRSQPQRWRISLAYTETGGGTGLWVDYLLLMPIRNRAATPTGPRWTSTDPAYPAFAPVDTATGAAITKVLRSDGSAALKVPRIGANAAPAAFPGGGLGHIIDLPNADCDMMVKLSRVVPNDPAAANAEMLLGVGFGYAWPVMIHVAVTPRFLAVRGA